MKTRKKILSLLLAAVMTLAVLPMTAVEVSAVGEVKARLDAFMKKEEYQPGKKWTGSYASAKECLGFARLVTTTVFGKKNGEPRKWSYSGANRNGMKTIASVKKPFKADKIKELLRQARCGDVLQYDGAESIDDSIHSLIVYAVDSKGAKFYDCNGVATNTIGFKYKTFSEIAKDQINSPKLTLLRSDNYEDIENLPKLTISHNANGGTVSSNTYKLSGGLIYSQSDNKKVVYDWAYGTKRKNGLVNASTYGLSRPGYTFKGWGTKASGGTVFDEDDTDLLPEKIDSNLKNGNRSITLYAIWTPNVLTVSYHANGGTVTSDTYKLNNSLVYKQSTNAILADRWSYGVDRPTGPYNAATFGLSRTGYSFKGWSTSLSGEKLFGETDGTILAEHINPSLVKGNCSSTLYAIWKPNTYTITYNANGGTGTTANSIHTYDTTKALSTNGFFRTGYTFLGWSADSSADSAAYTDQEAVGNLASTDGATLTLYAVWQKDPTAVPGDTDGDGAVNDSDVEYLLYHIFYPELYPAGQNCDFNGDGEVNDKDAEYLLYHIFFPEGYPLP